MTLRISTALALPPEAVTETFGIVGLRGSGKSYIAKIMVEEMLAAHYQTIVIDPTDAWWGLRTGTQVVIFGGEHSDLPIEPGAGRLLADVLVETGQSAVLSLRHLSKAKQRQFVAEFAERLYHRKGEKQYRTPLHIVIDESDAYVPQRVMGDVARCHGAIDDLVRRGRSSGIGVTLITQRPAVVSKDVLSQVEVLVTFRLVSPQDRKALDAWVEAHDSEGRAKEFAASLASLPQGECWWWSPGWLNLFTRVKARKARTFDSSATPKFGTKLAVPKLLPLDLDVLRAQMADTVEKAEKNDPAVLRKRIVALERERATLTAKAESAVVERVVETVEVPVVPATAITLLESIESALRALADGVQANAEGIEPVLAMIRTQVGRAESLTAAPSQASKPRPSTAGTIDPLAGTIPRLAPPLYPMTSGRQVSGNGGDRRMLEALARFPAGMTDAQCATQSKLKRSGGTFSTYVSRLVQAGLAVRPAKGQLQITTAGMELVGATGVDGLSGEELRDDWRGRLGGGCRRMYDVLIAAYPNVITKTDLAERADLTLSGGTFSTYVSRLRTNGLLEQPADGEYRAHPDLFMEATR